MSDQPADMVTHSDIINQMKTLRVELEVARRKDDEAHVRIDKKLDKFDRLFYGTSGANDGLLSDVVAIKLMLKIGVWIVAAFGAASIVALVGIFRELATRGQ